MEVVVVIRWDEKAGLRRDAVRSQVIDALEVQSPKQPASNKTKTPAPNHTRGISPLRKRLFQQPRLFTTVILIAGCWRFENRQMRRCFCLCSIVIVLVLTAGCGGKSIPPLVSRSNPQNGYVQDGDTAIAITEAICTPFYGRQLVEFEQPARLRSYLADALQDGPLNDGLLQRFQVLVYPDSPQDWRYVDRPPLAEAISNAERMYHRLAHLDAAQPLRFRFEGAAQELFVAWLTDLESKLRGVDLHPALVSHLAKYRSLMPSLALLFELADGGTDTISLAHTRQSAAFCDYLESH
jgi:hypothetical protein